MLFVDGNPNLVGQARLYLGDPSTAANTRHSDQEVKNLLNIEYLNLRDLLRIPSVGWCRKRAYADGVAVDSPDDHFYSLPADYVGRLRVEISTNGSDLSSVLPGSNPSILVLTPTSYDVALDHYNVDSGGTSDIKYVFLHGQHFGISTPLTATEAGTSSIRITYEASTAELSAGSDEPDLPRPHHDVIAMGAAVKGRIAHGIDVRDLERQYQMGVAKLQRAAWSVLADYDSQMTVAGRRPPTRRTQSGTFKRR